MERVALFGGTFDPPHLGHLIIAECARESLSLDRVEFLVSADPPHKLDVARSPFADRRAMVALAISGAPSFVVNDSECSRPGPSFTVDTLRLRQEERPEERLWFLMGADSLIDLPTWREPEAILNLARLAVAARPGSPIAFDVVERSLPGATGVIDLVTTPLIDISSRELRRRVLEERSIAYRVPSNVHAYIRSRELYLEPA
jgi:nicotinate-nucleotide adenylyltransferase